MSSGSFSAIAALAATVALAGCATQPTSNREAAQAAGARDYFYVGGRYVGEPGKELMSGQMYVERLLPARVTQPLPLVLVHGAAQTATNNHWVTESNMESRRCNP